MNIPTAAASTGSHQDIESPYAWARLAVALALMTIGSSGMYIVVVALPPVQAAFSTTRSDVSIAYALTMVGLGAGGILMGRLSDRFGVMVTVLIGAVSLGLGYIAASAANSLWQFSLAQGLLIGLLGTSATFAPLVADISHWFARRRGIAVAICISGNYVAGAMWPPIVQHFFDSVGWRQTYFGVGVFCLLAMPPLALALRRRRPPEASILVTTGNGVADVPSRRSPQSLGLSPAALQTALCVAGVGCCVAMAMPQVHIIAYCGDLGFAAARGAEMLSLMLGFGVVSRLASGWISDRIGGLRTLLLGAVLQGIALLLFIPFDGLASLYVASGLFGLFQGGLIPAYAIIVREYFSPREAGARVGTVLMATLLGMALGGWLGGALFDLTGSYRAAFVNSIAWNLLTIAIALALLRRSRGGPQPFSPVPA